MGGKPHFVGGGAALRSNKIYHILGRSLGGGGGGARLKFVAYALLCTNSEPTSWPNRSAELTTLLAPRKASPATQYWFATKQLPRSALESSALNCIKYFADIRLYVGVPPALLKYYAEGGGSSNIYELLSPIGIAHWIHFFPPTLGGERGRIFIRFTAGVHDRRWGDPPAGVAGRHGATYFKSSAVYR